MKMVTPVADAPIQPELAERATKWEYLVVPLQEANGLTQTDDPWAPDRLNELGDQGWEAIGLSLNYGDVIAWPVVLLKRPVT